MKTEKRKKLRKTGYVLSGIGAVWFLGTLFAGLPVWLLMMGWGIYAVGIGLYGVAWFAKDDYG
jgi:hypothetical protein